MSDNSNTETTFTPSWINVVNSNELFVRQQLEGHSYQLNLDHDTTCCFKSFSGGSPDAEHLLLFNSPHGPFALDNAREFFQALLGIPFGDMDLSTFSKTLSIYLEALPEPFATVFGWISPNFFSSVNSGLFCATLQLQAPGCTVTNTMLAAPSFWTAILASPELVKVELEQSVNLSFSATRVPVVLGSTTLNKGELSDLLPGDIFRLDKSLFQADNQGVISLGSKRVEVVWVSRGETDILKVRKHGEQLCK